MSRVLAIAGLLTLALVPAPAVAQSDAEIIGTYTVTIEPEPGSVCQAGTAKFEVLKVGGGLMEIALDGTHTVADWDPVNKTFAGRIPFPDGDNVVRLDGTFVRSSRQVDIVVQVEFPPSRPCKALLGGSIPLAGGAGPSTPPPPPLGGTPTTSTPAPSTPPVFGVSPNGEPPVYGPPPQRGLKDAGLLGAVFVLMLLLGLMLGFRRKKAGLAEAPTPAAAPAPTAEPKPAPPDPAPPAAPEAKVAPAAKPAPAPKPATPRERSPVSRAAKPSTPRERSPVSRAARPAAKPKKPKPPT